MLRPWLIRPARPHDAGALGAIYDEGVRSGVATFATGAHDEAERRRWLAARSARAPVFCGEAHGRVVAWSALAPLSHREWYDGVAEYTVYVTSSARGRGLGRQMLDHLLETAPTRGYWKLVGMIMVDNRAALALARTAGFRVVGAHRAHARVAGRWRDVAIVERHLDPGVAGEANLPS